jgi:hypothetical protein
VLSITTSNVVWLDKNVKTIFQEEANEIFLCQFSKMSRWVEIASTPTLQQKHASGVEDFQLKSSCLVDIRKTYRNIFDRLKTSTRSFLHCLNFAFATDKVHDYKAFAPKSPGARNHESEPPPTPTPFVRPFLAGHHSESGCCDR